MYAKNILPPFLKADLLLKQQEVDFLLFEFFSNGFYY